MNIMLLGSNGQLGKELERNLSMVGNLYSFSKSSIDITNYEVIKNKTKIVKPDVEEGDMIFLNSNTLHRSPINKSNKRKSIIAFNLNEKILK